MASISGLEADINRLEKKKTIFQQRIQKLEAVQSGLHSSVEARIGDANKDINTCAKNIEAAISVPDCQTTAPEEVRKSQEHTVEADSYMSQVSSYIKREIDRCRTEVNELTSKISSLKAEVKRLKEEERK